VAAMTRVQIPGYVMQAMRGDDTGTVVKTKWMKATAVHVRQLELSRFMKGRDRASKVELATVRLDRSGEYCRVILGDCKEVP
jgi:hypothetical protein